MSDNKSTTVRKLEGVRLSFPSLFKTRSYDNDDGDGGKKKSEPKYEATFLLDKVRHAKVIEQIRADIKAAKMAKFPDAKGFKGCLRDGAEKEDLEGYTDKIMFIKAASRRRPAVVDRNREPLTEEDAKLYAGCYVNATISYWVQNNKFGKRINANLRAVQFVKDGKAFGDAPVDAESEFDELEDDGSVDKKSRADDDDNIPGVDDDEGSPEKDDIL